MRETVKVLDHGFVTLRNLAGPTRRDSVAKIFGNSAVTHKRLFDADDTDPANSARMSFDASDLERGYEVEMKLNRYLMKNQHMTPFESIEVWLEMKLPIFVARQFVRHRTASLNEVSGRYVTLPAEWYIPDVVGGKAPSAKQGQADNLPEETQLWFRHALENACANSYANYLEAIKRGVAPEHARLFLHLNHYTHWLWKQNLRNMLHFLALRDHSHAQVEAQAYAKAVASLLSVHLPGLMELYAELRT